MRSFDVVGLGLNATDTVIVVPRFPAYAGKAPYEREFTSAGGQVATAMVACARLGLRARYIGAIGDDERGRFQGESLQSTGVDLSRVLRRQGCANQSAIIVIDASTGERTIFWRHDECLKIKPEEIKEDDIASARLLLIDGHDPPARARAAAIAREHGIPVVVDVDTIYPGFDDVLPNVDYLLASAEFPAAWTGLSGCFEALEALQTQFGMKVAAMTLGKFGSLARCGGAWLYAPGYVVDCVDSTGAGDVFHGAFCYAVLQGMPMLRAFEFSNAMAALNCTAMGARGGIRGVEFIDDLMAHAARRPHPEIAARITALSGK